MKHTTNDVDLHLYDNTKAEELKQKTKKALAENIIQTGIRDAEEGLPTPLDDSLNTYLDPELNGLQQYVEDLRDLHRADETTSSTIDKLHRDSQDERNNRDEISAELQNKQRQLEKYDDKYPSLLAMLLSGIVLMLGLMEGLMSLQALQSFIPSYTIALPVSLIFGGGLAILAHKFLPWFNAANNKLSKLVRRVGLIASFSSVFYGLGLLRSYQIALGATPIEDITTSGIYTLADPQEALIYCLLSWLIFLPAVIISKYTPSKQEWISIFKRRTVLKEIKTLQLKLELSQSEIKRLNSEIENLKIWEESRLTTAKRDEQSAIQMIAYLKSLYIQANLRHRLDKKRPDCFDAPFKFYLTLYHQDTPNTKPNHSTSNN